MSGSPTTLRDDAIAIWRAGVDAVRAETLMQAAVRREGDSLIICDQRLPIAAVGRIAVVGAGKAGAGMAAGFEQAVGDDLLDRLTGWVNVPTDCVRPLAKIQLHAARPAGLNEPTAEGVAGTEHILELVGNLGPSDVCIVLLSGGGSALLPAPIAGVSLADKQAITRSLSQAGASIGELNCVRKHLSRIKGGRLAAACTAGTLITLIISDVIGDPLDVIASGPTVPDTTTATDALAVLNKYADRLKVPPSIVQALTQSPDGHAVYPQPSTHNYVIGNIDVALDAAAEEARRRGYDVHSLGGSNTGIARDVGVELAERCLSLASSLSPIGGEGQPSQRSAGRQGEGADAHPRPAHSPVCLLSGGEPTVEVVPTAQPRKGGRNQELVLAAVQRLWNEDISRLALLSGGTDGEDGPTDAAGAFIDAGVIARAKSLHLNPAEFLAINNSYPFFEQAGGHLKTGPTQTNVMDLRVAVVR